jgi:hypothetical protein
VSGEYLLWWTKGSHVPPLATAGTPAGSGGGTRRQEGSGGSPRRREEAGGGTWLPLAAGTPAGSGGGTRRQEGIGGGPGLPPADSRPAGEGRLGDPGTAVVLGDNDLEGGARSGGRFTLGYWLDDLQDWSVQVNFLVLGDRSINLAASSDEFPVLGRPFFDLRRQVEATEPVAFPGAAAGSVSVNRTSLLWGVDADLSANAACCPWYRVDVLAGLRYLDLREDLSITEASSVRAGAGAVLPALAPRAGDSFLSTDAFRGVDRFLGGTIGVTGEVARGCWTLTLVGKLSLGGEKEEALAAGRGVVTHRAAGGARAVLGEGLLAQPPNAGDFRRTTFAAVPEVGVTLGYQVTDHVRVYGGYNFLYFSDVLRPEDQIDPLRGRARASDFWAQGLDFGMAFSY